jgi:predicted nucleic acid-binding protein
MPAFLDSTVLLFLTTQEKAKADKAMSLLANEAVVSAQVLVEIADAERGVDLDWKRTSDFTEVVATLARVVPVTLDTFHAAAALAQKYDLAIRDAIMVAAALEAGCDRLYSPSLKFSAKIEDKLTVVDPFAA